MDDFSVDKRRWYDQQKRLSVAVELVLKFPGELQRIICDGLVALAEHEFKAHELLSQFKSLGPDKVLAIYKSKQKHRYYDENPVVHKTVNYFYVLSDANRLSMADHIISLTEVVHDYLKLCKKHQATVDYQEAGALTTTYVKKGEQAARKLLGEFERLFHQKVQEAKTRQFVPNNSRQEHVQEAGEDLRLRDFR